MNVRAYRDADLAAVADLFTAAVHEGAARHYDASQRAAWAPRPPDLERWRERLAPLCTLVAEDDAGLAGFLAYAPDGHVDLLFTAPDRARRGVATALVERAEAELAAAGATELSTEASLVARPLFERHGFRVVEEQTVERDGVALRRFAMRKSLG